MVNIHKEFYGSHSINEICAMFCHQADVDEVWVVKKNENKTIVPLINLVGEFNAMGVSGANDYNKYIMSLVTCKDNRFFVSEIYVNENHHKKAVVSVVTTSVWADSE